MDPDDRPVADGVVVGRDRRVALRVVADVHEQLRGRLRDGDPLEQAAGRSSLLRDDRVLVARRSVGIADGVGPALCDAGEQRLRRERPVDGATRREAVSSDAAHFSELLGVDPRLIRREA